MRLLLFFSYLDPGTGSIVAQAIIGVIAGIGLFGRNLLIKAKNKARNLLSKVRSKGKDS